MIGHELQLEDVTCVRGDRALFRGLGFRVTNGGLLRVRGRNGSGKSSLLRMICGLLPTATGAIRWNDREIHSLGEEFHTVLAYVGHSNAVKDELGVREQLVISARLAGMTPADREITDALEALGLEQIDRLPCRVLSQGQKRRLALARLRIGARRPLWVLDEPFAALDAPGIEIVCRMIGDHLRDGGLAVITTHQEVRIESRGFQEIDLPQ